MSKREPHIEILPDLSRLNKKVNIDPDVDAIINEKNTNNIDILKMSHEPTQEEQDDQLLNKTSCKSRWSLLIIILAIIILIIIIIIIWFVLKTNNEDNSNLNQIPKNIIQPSKVYPNQQHGYSQPHANLHHMNQYNQHPMHPNNMQQTENIQIQTKSMQPSKKDLLNTLHKMKLEPIVETDETEERDPELTPKTDGQTNKPVIKTETESVGEDIEDTQDNKIAKTFYRDLQKNIDNDEADDSDNDDNANNVN